MVQTRDVQKRARGVSFEPVDTGSRWGPSWQVLDRGQVVEDIVIEPVAPALYRTTGLEREATGMLARMQRLAAESVARRALERHGHAAR